MVFRTEYIPQKAEFSLSPAKKVTMLGSCFAQNISTRMRCSLWCADNPAGTLYNPLSIERVIRLLLFTDDFRSQFENSLFQSGSMFHSWLFDSKFSAESKEDSLLAATECQSNLRSLLDGGETLFITFGTSWCYFLSDNPDYVVANCHKQPSATFVRRRLRIEEIVNTWSALASDLKKLYPGLRIIFTVSPVRHMKDGFEGNARSKATLLIAVEELCSKFDFCSYFPAYEILNDDLRDYRFYASDLVHPSAEAVEYIWEVFKATYLDKEGLEILKEGERIFKGWCHRPLPNATRIPSEAFLQAEKNRLEELTMRHRLLKEKYPAILPLP